MVNKKGLVVQTSPDLTYILPYYFYLFHVIYYFYLTKINVYLFLFHIPTKFINEEKSISQWWFVCVVCSEIFTFSSVLRVVPKTILLLPTMVATITSLISQFGENILKIICFSFWQATEGNTVKHLWWGFFEKS